MPPLLFDVHVHHGAGEVLRSAGVDVRHAGDDPELRVAEDLDLLLAAAEEGRVLVTWNYRDFAPLVEALAERGRSFPGVLFLSPSLGPSDLSGHVRAIRRWWERAGDDHPVEGGAGWIRPA